MHLARLSCQSAMIAVLNPCAAFAQPEALIGVGWNGLKDYGALAGSLEARTVPLLTVGGFEIRLGAAGEIDTDADVWGGVGIVVTVPFLESFRLEASFMPGLYASGSGKDLGGPVQFRSLLGVSYEITTGYRLGIAVTHKSNADIYDGNPGEDSIFAFLAVRF